MSSTAEPSPRGRVLAALDDHHTRTGTSVTANELAGVLDLHPSTVRFHLRKLVDAGQVIEDSPNSGAATAGTGTGTSPTPDETNGDGTNGNGRGRPRKQYLPTPPTPTDTLLTALVEALADTDTEREERAAQAGRIWASTVADSAVTADTTDPLDAAAQVLTALGFEIQAMSSIFGTCEIRVCSCPLRLLGQHHLEVARGIQRGAVEQALAVFPGRTDPWTVTSRPDPRFGDCEVTLRFSPERSLTT